MARRATKQKKNTAKRPLLIPPHERELSHVDYLVSLADIALGRKKNA